MDTRINPPLMDHLEAERFQAMLESPSWLLYERTVQAELDRWRGSCERSDGDLEMRRAQGGVSALRMTLAMPNQILAKLRGAKKK